MQKLFVQPTTLIRWFAGLFGKTFIRLYDKTPAYLSGKNGEDEKPADPYWQKQVHKHWVDVPYKKKLAPIWSGPPRDHNDPINRGDYVWASSHYLCKSLPHDFEDWDDDKLRAFVSDNAWYPYGKTLDAEEIYERITWLAISVREYIQTDPDYARGREEHELGSGVDEEADDLTDED
tara:strand:- start:2806 stop:3336 length:531 start_codon:yes stop_codon:yes gene_type:complete